MITVSYSDSSLPEEQFVDELFRRGITGVFIAKKSNGEFVSKIVPAEAPGLALALLNDLQFTLYLEAVGADGSKGNNGSQLDRGSQEIGNDPVPEGADETESVDLEFMTAQELFNRVYEIVPTFALLAAFKGSDGTIQTMKGWRGNMTEIAGMAQMISFTVGKKRDILKRLLPSGTKSMGSSELRDLVDSLRSAIKGDFYLQALAILGRIDYLVNDFNQKTLPSPNETFPVTM